MQCPPTPGPGLKGMNPNGLVAAASITSHRFTPSSWQNTAISLTKAIFTWRKVFFRARPQASRRGDPRGDHLLGGAGVGRRLQNHQIPDRKVRGYHVHRRDHHRQVGRSVDQRGRDADDVAVATAEYLRIGRELQVPRAESLLELGVAHVLDRAPPGGETPDVLFVDVIADDTVARFRRRQRERKADVAQPQDSDSPAGHGSPEGESARIAGGRVISGGLPVVRTLTIRSAVWPSHSAGRRDGCRARRICSAQRRIRSGSSPTRRLLPSVTVTGRSVFSRSVMHGTPSTVVSSWTPPESVSTSRALTCSFKKSR